MGESTSSESDDSEADSKAARRKPAKKAVAVAVAVDPLSDEEDLAEPGTTALPLVDLRLVSCASAALCLAQPSSWCGWGGAQRVHGQASLQDQAP